MIKGVITQVGWCFWKIELDLLWWNAELFSVLRCSHALLSWGYLFQQLCRSAELRHAVTLVPP